MLRGERRRQRWLDEIIKWMLRAVTAPFNGKPQALGAGVGIARRLGRIPPDRHGAVRAGNGMPK